jgi:cupin fold WbuC family metalloprotein
MDKLGVTSLKVHKDDRGDLFEVIHDYDLKKFGQQYVVRTRNKGTIRAFHRHEELWDWFTIISGSAKFLIVEPDGSATHQFVLDARTPEVLTVPPGYWHGWMALEDNTVLNSVASHCYNKDKPDEERVPPDSFNVTWEIKFK